ncbi:DUF2786 domain-containing protein [Bacillus pumilus]|uniref:DUF2786 domain-containing protein n=1 Tax=Bacillus pumilus TaxID=1408 RepID=UPI00211366E7|nr:DUF2786 domain-containing protein [Bacillus pumilus]UUD44608.1 DUF2786 domain-containing protein [Bacillus pumilus]
MNRNESIIKKIKGLLAIADDSKNDEESQSAFLLAQKLMIKHDIQQSDVETTRDEKQEIIKGQAVAYKKLFWWERQLAGIIANNFRVKFYYHNRFLNGEKRRKSSIIFFGFENDVNLAKEMYVLAYDAISKYSTRFVKNYYQRDAFVIRTKEKTKELKNSYMLGFLTGLSEKFEKQVKEMEQEFGLMVITPKEVSRAYNDLAKGFSGKAKPVKTPSIGEVEAYHRGRKEGEQMDYLKQTIDDDITNF